MLVLIVCFLFLNLLLLLEICFAAFVIRQHFLLHGVRHDTVVATVDDETG